MKRGIFLIIICALFLVGCNSKQVVTNENVVIDFNNKSESWDVSYKIVGNEKLHDSYFTFKYIGTDSSTVKDVKYSIDGPREGGSGTFIYENSNGYGYTDRMKLTGGLPDNNDRGINVKVEWNGKTEILTLKMVK